MLLMQILKEKYNRIDLHIKKRKWNLYFLQHLTPIIIVQKFVRVVLFFDILSFLCRTHTIVFCLESFLE
jgi:hypothetical protein